MIPHQSWAAFCTILDLSFCLWNQGTLLESVNLATVQQAPAGAMLQLGNCMKWLEATLADKNNPNNSRDRTSIMLLTVN